MQINEVISLSDNQLNEQLQINSFLPSAGTNITKIIQLINGAQEVIACGVC